MEFDFDPAKNKQNVRERGLSFERAGDFDFQTAMIIVDTRRDYGEVRFRALGWLDGRLHALVFTRIAQGIRIISFRKANKREVKRYEQETQS
jgi:uncharacterized DUF497 family protein